ncbi:MAG: hypothetical protein ACRENO_00965, partial [Thermodesulfobacteriota bacterium]
MKVFFDKRFLIVVFILLVSFVTLVYSQIAFDKDKKSNISNKKKIDNKEVVASMEKDLVIASPLKIQLSQNNLDQEGSDSVENVNQNNADSAADGEIVDSQNDLDINSEPEPEDPKAVDSLEENLDKINKRLEEINKDDNVEKAQTKLQNDIKNPKNQEAQIYKDSENGLPEKDNENNVKPSSLPANDLKEQSDKLSGKSKTQNKPTITEDIVNLQSEMELKDLIQTMSEITSDTYILDEGVKGQKVTIITPTGGFKKQNALRLFETLLDINGFSIVKNNGVNKIVQKKDIKSET